MSWRGHVPQDAEAIKDLQKAERVFFQKILEAKRVQLFSDQEYHAYYQGI